MDCLREHRRQNVDTPHKMKQTVNPVLTAHMYVYIALNNYNYTFIQCRRKVINDQTGQQSYLATQVAFRVRKITGVAENDDFLV